MEKENYKQIITQKKFTFKNYKEMCNELGEKCCGGKQKKIQLERFKNYFSFHFEGHKVIIDSIKENPDPLINKRIQIRSDTTKRIKELLYDEFVKQYDNTKEYSFTGTRKNYLSILCFASSVYLGTRRGTLNDVVGKIYYREKRKRVEEFIMNYNITNDDYYDFIVFVEEIFRISMRNSFKSLTSHNLLTECQTDYIIVRGVINRYGETCELHEVATTNEVSEILNHQEKVLHKFSDDDDFERLSNVTTKDGISRKFNNNQILHITGKYNDYREELNKAICEKLKCRYIYKPTKMTIGQDTTTDELRVITSDKIKTQQMCAIINRVDVAIKKAVMRGKITADKAEKYYILLQEIVRDDRYVPIEDYPIDLICLNKGYHAIGGIQFSTETGEIVV